MWKGFEASVDRVKKLYVTEEERKGGKGKKGGRVRVREEGKESVLVKHKSRKRTDEFASYHDASFYIAMIVGFFRA